MTFFTPLADGDLGRAEEVNSRLREMEAAITARRGVMVQLVEWTTLTADAAYLSINVPLGYARLKLIACLRSNGGVTSDSLKIALNDEFINTYKTRVMANGSDASYNTVDGWTVPACAASPTSPAGNYGALTVNIAEASSSNPKQANFESTVFYLASSGLDTVWGSASTTITSPIVRIRMTPVSGTLLMAGSHYTLCGMN
jgi:hypothetical protein